jgi:ferric-dicitrate binding protein FerR (iron transport regulator)
MSALERGHELIQKHFEALASEAELAELERLLATDDEVANAFAEAARVHAGLQSHFRKQYKIDQVGALLDAVDRPGAPDAVPLRRGSTFVPRYAGRLASRRSGIGGSLATFARAGKWTAAMIVLVATIAGLWSLRPAYVEPIRLVSGRVAVGGRDVAVIPDGVEFEVQGAGSAAIALPGGARITLSNATRAAIRRDAGRTVVHLVWGGGDFEVSAGQTALRVETVLGATTSTEARFSLDLVTTPSDRLSSTEPLTPPRLTVTVAQGSVVVEYAGASTTLSAGEQRVFSNAT